MASYLDQCIAVGNLLTEIYTTNHLKTWQFIFDYNFG